MGTTAGIKDFVATVLVSGGLVAGGGATYLRSSGETCVYIPAGVAALSEPAYAALKADHIIVDGIIGWHYFYDPFTEKSSAVQRLHSKLMIAMHKKKFGDLIEPDDLNDTTPSMFFIRGADFDHQVVYWKDIEAAGYTVSSTSDVLQPCPSA